MYYVYFLVDPRNNLPFYIGKGSGNRAKSHLKETEENTDNIFKWRKINSIRNDGFEPIIDIIYKKLGEDVAYNIEETLIAFYGRQGIDKNGILTNRTPNGNPPSALGRILTEEQKEKRRGKNNPMFGKPCYYNMTEEEHQEWFKNVSEAGRKSHLGISKSDEHCKKISITKIGDKNPMFNNKPWNKNLEGVFNHNEEFKKDSSKRMSANNYAIKDKSLKNTKRVLCVELDQIFFSCKDAADSLGLKRYSDIWKCSNRMQRTAFGYHWKFVE